MPQVIAALCRHGHYEQPEDVPSAHLPHPLTAKGREQANRLVDDLLSLAGTQGWTLCPVIDTSPLLRSYETATILAEGLHERTGQPFEVHEIEALTERCLGAAANLTIAEIERVLERDPRFEVPPPGWKAVSEYRLPLPGAESLLEAGARVAQHLRTRQAELAQVAGGPFVKAFVGHGGSFRHAALALGALQRSDIPKLSMHYARPVCLEAHTPPPWKRVAGDWKLRKASHPAD